MSGLPPSTPAHAPVAPHAVRDPLAHQSLEGEDFAWAT